MAEVRVGLLFLRADLMESPMLDPPQYARNARASVRRHAWPQPVFGWGQTPNSVFAPAKKTSGS